MKRGIILLLFLIISGCSNRIDETQEYCQKNQDKCTCIYDCLDLWNKCISNESNDCNAMLPIQCKIGSDVHVITHNIIKQKSEFCLNYTINPQSNVKDDEPEPYSDKELEESSCNELLHMFLFKEDCSIWRGTPEYNRCTKVEEAWNKKNCKLPFSPYFKEVIVYFQQNPCKEYDTYGDTVRIINASCLNSCTIQMEILSEIPNNLSKCAYDYCTANPSENKCRYTCALVYEEVLMDANSRKEINCGDEK